MQLLDTPRATARDPLARLYIVDHLHPGGVIHRLIEVSNTTRSMMPIVLYPAAATLDKGSFVGAAGRTANNPSSWTRVAPRGAEIPAGGRLVARVTISVPRDAPAGQQYAVVWAETRSTPLADRGITEISRVGIRVYLSVGAGGAPPPKFVVQHLAARRGPDGRPVVTATVRNTGGIALNVYGALRLTNGPGASRAGPFAAKLGSTLPIGDAEPIKIILDKHLPAGPWTAILALHSGLLTARVRATISFPRTARSSPEVPLVGIMAALLLIAGLIVVAGRGRMRPPSPRARRSKLRPATVGGGDQ